MKNILHGPMDNYVKALKKPRFRAGNLDLPEIRRRYKVLLYTSGRLEEEEGAQSCPCGNADERRLRIVERCEVLVVYKEERNVLEKEKREINECDMGTSFGALLGNRAKMIARYSGRRMVVTDGQRGKTYDNTQKHLPCIWKTRTEPPKR